MTLGAFLIALLVQAAPAVQQPVAKASVAGVVVNSAGEPLPNIRVALARTDFPIGPLAQLLAGEPMPAEITFPGEVFAMMAQEIDSQVQDGVTSTDPGAAAIVAALKAAPVGDLQEIVVSPTGSIAVVLKSNPPVVTDDRGRFLFTDVQPGTYRLMFSGAGFARQSYGQRTVRGGGVPLTLMAGQAKTDIVMRMMAVGAVSGRIRDAAGQPVAGVPVELLQTTYDEHGQRIEHAIAGTRTDDRGDYRLYYLSPGRYSMRAGNPPGQDGNGILSTNVPELFALGAGYSTQNRIPENYTRLYYPGVVDATSATEIDVQSGADLRGIDLFLNVQQTYRVRGRVVDPATGRPPQVVNITVSLRNVDSLSEVISFGLSGNANYNAADGTFEVPKVGAGVYKITADVPGPPQARPPDFSAISPAERTAYIQSMEAQRLALPKAFATVSVINADIDGLLLTLGKAGSISGRVRAESSAQSAPVSFEILRFQLSDPSNGGVVVSDNQPQPRPVTPDGTFSIVNIWPGEYHLGVFGLPPNFYVKEARLGDVDVLNAPLRFTGEDSQTLEVLISPNTGAIEGTAVDAAGRPAPGVQVVLIPGLALKRPDLFKTVTADLDGRFTISGIAPGDYILAAWETLEPNAFFDPNIIRQAEEQGRAVRVSESSSQSMNVVAVP